MQNDRIPDERGIPVSPTAQPNGSDMATYGCECSNYLAHFGRAIWRYARPVTTLRRAYTAAGDRPRRPDVSQINRSK